MEKIFLKFSCNWFIILWKKAEGCIKIQNLLFYVKCVKSSDIKLKNALSLFIFLLHKFQIEILTVKDGTHTISEW